MNIRQFHYVSTLHGEEMTNSIIIMQDLYLFEFTTVMMCSEKCTATTLIQVLAINLLFQRFMFLF